MKLKICTFCIIITSFILYSHSIYASSCGTSSGPRDCPQTVGQKGKHKKQATKNPIKLGKKAHSKGTKKLGSVAKHEHKTKLQNKKKSKSVVKNKQKKQHQNLKKYHKAMGHCFHVVQHGAPTTRSLPLSAVGPQVLYFAHHISHQNEQLPESMVQYYRNLGYINPDGTLSPRGEAAGIIRLAPHVADDGKKSKQPVPDMAAKTPTAQRYRSFDHSVSGVNYQVTDPSGTTTQLDSQTVHMIQRDPTLTNPDGTLTASAQQQGLTMVSPPTPSLLPSRPQAQIFLKVGNSMTQITPDMMGQYQSLGFISPAGKITPKGHNLKGGVKLVRVVPRSASGGKTSKQPVPDMAKAPPQQQQAAPSLQQGVTTVSQQAPQQGPGFKKAKPGSQASGTQAQLQQAPQQGPGHKKAKPGSQLTSVIPQAPQASQPGLTAAPTGAPGMAPQQGGGVILSQAPQQGPGFKKAKPGSQASGTQAQLQQAPQQGPGHKKAKPGSQLTSVIPQAPQASQPGLTAAPTSAPGMAPQQGAPTPAQAPQAAAQSLLGSGKKSKQPVPDQVVQKTPTVPMRPLGHSVPGIVYFGIAGNGHTIQIGSNYAHFIQRHPNLTNPDGTLTPYARQQGFTMVAQSPSKKSKQPSGPGQVPTQTVTHALLPVEKGEQQVPKIETSKVQGQISVARPHPSHHVELYRPKDAGIYKYEEARQMPDSDFHLMVLGFKGP